MLSPDTSTDLQAGWDLDRQGQGQEPVVPDSDVAWGHAQDAYQIAGLGGALKGLLGREAGRTTSGILKQAAVPPPLRLEREKVKSLLDSIPDTLDETPLTQKYTDTGTLNLPRSHQGSAPYQKLYEISKGDPAAMLDAAENAGDLTKVFNLIGKQMNLTDAPQTHKSITSRTREQMLEDLAPILEGRQTGLADAKQLHALSSVHAAAGDALLTTARAIKYGRATDEMRAGFALQVQTAAAVEALLVGNTREVARALSARRIYADSIKGADLMSLTKAFQQDGMTPADIDKAAKNFLDSYLKHGKTKATHDAATKRDPLSIGIELWKSNILSGPPGQLANIATSSATHLYESFAVDSAAAAVSTARRALGIGGDEGVYFSEIADGLRGSIAGMKDGLMSALTIWTDPKAVGDLTGYGKPGRTGGVVDTAEAAGAAVGMPNAGRRAGAAAVYPLQFMRGADEAVASVAYRAKVAELEMRDARNRGLTGQAMTDFLADASNNESRYSDEAREYARKVTFQSDQTSGLTGLISQHATRFVEAIPVLKFIAPFINTMSNLVAYAIDNSPLALAAVNVEEGATGMARSQLFADLQAGGAKADYAFARFTTGTAFAGIAYMLYQNGVITGAGPGDPKQLAAAQSAGFKPSSFIVDGQAYSYNRLDPFAAQLGTIADAFDRARFAKTEQDASGLIFDAISSFAHHMASSTFAGQAKQFLEIIDGSSGVAASKIGANILTGFIPYSSMLTSAARALDDTQRSASFQKKLGFSGEGTMADIGQIMVQTGAMKLPWSRDELRPARYWDGEIIVPEAHELVRFLLPVQISSVSKNPADKILLRNGIAPAVPSSLISVVNVQFNLLDFDLGKGLVYDAYVEAIGLARKDAVNEVIGNSEFADAGRGISSQQAIALEKAMSAGHKAGERKFFSEILPAMVAAKKVDLNPLAKLLGEDLEGTLRLIKSGELSTSPAMRFNAKGAPGKREVQLPMFDF